MELAKIAIMDPLLGGTPLVMTAIAGIGLVTGPAPFAVEARHAAVPMLETPAVPFGQQRFEFLVTGRATLGCPRGASVLMTRVANPRRYPVLGLVAGNVLGAHHGVALQTGHPGLEQGGAMASVVETRGDGLAFHG